jgi:hypothetical protein
MLSAVSTYEVILNHLYLVAHESFLKDHSPTMALIYYLLMENLMNWKIVITFVNMFY